MSDRHREIKTAIENSIQNISEKGHYKLIFQIILDKKAFSLCREAYTYFGGISIASFERILADVKYGGTTKFNDTTKVQVPKNELKKFLKLSYNIDLDEKQLSRINIPPRKTKTKVLYDWIDKFLTVASCTNPTDGKLQIELCGIEELYLIYVR